jgi:hypothetical protein
MHSDFPLCPLCPLWLDFSDRCLHFGSGSAGLGSIAAFRIIGVALEPVVFRVLRDGSHLG